MATAGRYVPGHQSVVTVGSAALVALGYATIHNSVVGSMDGTDGRAHEDVTRSVSPPKAIAAAGVTTALLIAARSRRGEDERRSGAGWRRPSSVATPPITAPWPAGSLATLAWQPAGAR